jgi:hypothetical protein
MTLSIIIIGEDDANWRCTDSHPTGEDGVTLLSLYLNVSSSLEDNNALPFVGSSLHLHSILRCLEAKM